MKTYKGWRLGPNPDTASENIVVVANDEKPQDGSRELPHEVLHSPTGLNWGYGGSGPADLARAILFDLLGPIGKMPVLYQAFKAEFLIHMGNDWTLPEGRIRTWLMTDDGRQGLASAQQQLEVFNGPGEADPADDIETTEEEHRRNNEALKDDKGTAETALMLIAAIVAVSLAWLASVVPR